MEKILNIDGRDVKFKSSGAFLLKYKMQFQRDAFKDLIKLSEAIDVKTKTVKNADCFDLEVFFNMAWVLAKNANPQLPPPMEWLDSFSEFPVMDIIPEIMDLIMSTIKTTKEVKKKA